MKRRLLSILLVFVMVLGMFPTFAMAEDVSEGAEKSFLKNVVIGGMPWR